MPVMHDGTDPIERAFVSKMGIGGPVIPKLEITYVEKAYPPLTERGDGYREVSLDPFDEVMRILYICGFNLQRYQQGSLDHPDMSDHLERQAEANRLSRNAALGRVPLQSMESLFPPH